VSTIKVDTITDRGGSGTPYIKGAVLQVKQDILTTAWSSSASSTAFEDTPLSVTITPQSTSSKILITGMLNCSSAVASHGDFKVVRNGADILLSPDSSSQTKSHIHLYYYDSPSIYQIQGHTLNLLDEPSSTSALTYTLQGGTPHSAGYVIYLNRATDNTDANWNARTVSTITVMEIGG
tara:strand:- start:52 stop:588 length:537 start_codon:yes stop_codon:yes gene_type:complete